MAVVAGIRPWKSIFVEADCEHRLIGKAAEDALAANPIHMGAAASFLRQKMGWISCRYSVHFVAVVGRKEFEAGKVGSCICENGVE